MRHSCYAFLVLGLALAATAKAQDDDRAAARALLAKALQAHGGAAELAKWPALTTKIKGTLHTMGQAMPFSGEFAIQGASQHKFDVEAELAGLKIRIVHVLNGDKAWDKVGDDTEENDAEQLAEAKEEAYAGWVATLVPLQEKAFTLAGVGEIQIAKRPALGIRVSRKDHRDVNLYFDKETGLLVKTETRVKDEGDQEVTEETFLSDYKDVQGTRQAMKIVIHYDGKPYLEGELSDYRLAQRLDESVFAKP
jgi:hypothetical protein